MKASKKSPKESKERNVLIKELKRKDIDEEIEFEYVEDMFLKEHFETETGAIAFENRKPTEAFKKWKEQKAQFTENLLMERYQKETGDNAKEKGKFTKEYEIWKRQPFNNLAVLRKEIRSVFTKLPKKETQKDLIERRLQKIGEEIALLYPVNEIIAAIKEAPEGSAVHGFLQIHYEDHKDLIKKYYILDRALTIALKVWAPKAYTVVEKVVLKECYKEVLELENEEFFDHEPHYPFQKVIVYSRKPFENAVQWKEGVPKTVKFYPGIPVTLGYSNINVLIRAMWNTPMIHVAHSPGKDYITNPLVYDQEEIEKEKKKVNELMIAQLQKEIKMALSKADYYKISDEGWREMTTEAQAKLDVLTKHFARKKIKEADTRSFTEKKANYSSFCFFLVLIIAIIVIFVIVTNIIGSSGIPLNSNRTVISALLSFLNIFN